jgi:TonB family protein
MNSGEGKFNPSYQWQAPSRRNHFGISAIVHVIAILLLVKFGGFSPLQVTETPREHETLTWIAPEPAPLRHPKIAPPPPKILAQLRKAPVLPLPRRTPPPAKVEAPKVEAKVEPPKIETPKPKLPEPRTEVAKVEPPKKEVQPAHFDSAPAPVATPAPRREVADAGFGGSSAPATVKAPARKVQTGGFGDPNGVPPQNSPNREGAKIAALGSFDLPNGSGYGNGTGGAHGIRGTVADSGFGNGAAMGGSGSGTGPRKTVASAGFGSASDAVAAAPRAAAVMEKPQLKPVEITYKPKPAYTTEARELHIEGDVLLEVSFGADGQLRVLRVMRGLGHGLDESAQKAAQQIRFKPASRNGQPTDSTAMVHILFLLAE